MTRKLTARVRYSDSLSPQEEHGLHRCLDRIAAGVSVFATSRRVTIRAKRWNLLTSLPPLTTAGETSLIPMHRLREYP